MLNIYQLKDQLLGKKVAIDDVVTTYSSRLSSHKSAWAYLLKNQLEWIGIQADVLDKDSNLMEYDVWLIALPMEFQGSYNLFGGAGDEPADRIARLLEFKGPIWILNREMPDVGAFVLSRAKSCSEGWAALDPIAISDRCKQISTIDLTLDTGTFILGDSHSVSVYRPGVNISRNDGKTLFGILREGMHKWIPEGTNHLITCFGNIDVRHHIMRREDPIGTARRLAMDYIERLKRLNIERIELHALLPIEHEGRRIPKTGWYKGAPFSGSRTERIQVMQAFNHTITELGTSAGFKVLHWPEHWFELTGKQFAEQYMERPGSVHLSREYYYWDWSTGDKNPKLNNAINSLF